MTKDELLAVLDDMRAAVATDDSFEGSLEYLMPEPLGIDTSKEFAVMASYRIGNKMGRGGLRLFGETS